MFFDQLPWLEGIWYRVTQGPFLQNELVMGQILKEENIFKDFTINSNIRQNSPSPPPGSYVFWPINMTWRNLRQSPKEHFYKIIWKSVNQFWKRIFFFQLAWKPEFCMNKKYLRNFGEDIEMMLFVKFYPSLPAG